MKDYLVKEDVIRTPDERFENLAGYNFTPNYIEIEGLRLHYLDEGPADSKPVLLLHGEPSWSYLYRKMIPPLIDKGNRVIAPDLIGFGRSDKFLNKRKYSYQFHVDIMTQFVRQLNLANITLFVQDWGGLIGLRVVAKEPNRYARIVASNTGLPDAGGLMGFIGHFLFKIKVWAEGKVEFGLPWEEISITNWVAYTQQAEDLPIGPIIQAATENTLSEEIIAGYEAPFPSNDFKVAAKLMPSLITSQLRENHKAWKQVFTHWTKPFLTAFSDNDPITRDMVKDFHERIPGSSGQPHVTIKGAKHFVQEDKGEELAEVIIDFIKRNE